MNVLIHRQEGERSYAEMFRRYKARVFIAMSAQAFAQLNGINVISYYAPLVFESAGWTGRGALLMTGINGITYFLSTIPPWYLVDRLGRRPILLSGAVMMSLSLSAIAYFLYLNVPSTPALVVTFVMIYNAAFGYSWGPIPWLYPPEVTSHHTFSGFSANLFNRSYLSAFAQRVQVCRLLQIGPSTGWWVL